MPIPGASVPEPGAPGPYVGPGEGEVPDGWHTFGSDVHNQCGKYRLVFKNPDLQEDPDGFIHATGQFFIQFQAVGKGSAEVTRFSFSFGKTVDPVYNAPDEVTCNESIPNNPAGSGVQGAYLLYYRSDFDAKDGFFVPIITLNVPDGEYAAAVHAYSGSCSQPNPGCVEVARGWAKAIVDNCPGDVSATSGTCPGYAPEQLNDKIRPWPMILPGDGAQTNKDASGNVIPGLTIEFGEKVKDDTVKASINGERLALEKWDVPPRDNDLVPLNDETQCPANGLRYVCIKEPLGEGFKWLGEVKVGDVVRVEAVDDFGNKVEKTSHYGFGTSGGTVDVEAPVIVLQVLNGATVALKPGDQHEFNIRFENTGQGEAHVNLKVNVTGPAGDTGFSTQWTQLDGVPTDHLVIGEGQQKEVKLKVGTATSTPEEDFMLTAIGEWEVDGLAKTALEKLEVHVTTSASAEHTHSHGGGLQTTTNETGNGTGLEETKKEKDTPGLGVFGVLAAVGAAVAFAARRRFR